MRIVGIDIFGYALRYRHGGYAMSGGRVVDELPSTVVRVRTDEGIDGWGETCPLGSTYLPASAAGARAALGEIAPALVGLDPSNLALVNDAMDAALRGHAYAKSAVDIACWDVLGRAAGHRWRRSSAACGRRAIRSTWRCRSGPVDETVAHVAAAKRGGDPPLPAQARRRPARGRGAGAGGRRRDGRRARS